jgi:hypothetical protein
MPTPPGGYPSGYRIGHQREGFPELMAWADVVREAGRVDTAVRQMRAEFPAEFPEPVTVTSTTPIYLAEEVRRFFDAHPRQRTTIDEDMIRQIHGLIDGGAPRRRVAELLNISLNTVQNHANSPRS